LIVNDINHIVEKYTRELDDALRMKKGTDSPSIEHLASKTSSTDVSTLCQRSTMETLFESHVSKIMKSTTTKTTIDDGQGVIDRKESSQIYNETDCSIQSPKGNLHTQKFTFIHREKSKDDNEQEKTIVTSRIDQSNASDNDPPPLPLKRQTG
jgi:hypothetical protein